ncbi:MAG TPA: hypothetical protein VFH51_03405 [Myxococcota bacterium]|nr:hypothetical protein [Myxococcota bacterium]
MLSSLLVASLLLGADAPPSYASTLQAALAKAAQSWLGHAQKPLGDALKGGTASLAMSVEVGPDGGLRALRPGPGSGKGKVDALAWGWIAEAVPLPPPPVDLLGDSPSLECLVRLTVKRNATTAAVACPEGGEAPVETAGFKEGDADAAAHLLAGWHREASNDLGGATEAYRAAVLAAPTWDLAARALGLALVKQKRAAEAVPYLKTYVAARTPPADAAAYAREIGRFEAQQAARLADAKKVRPRLSKADIAQGVRKGYALLEPCLKVARSQRALAEGVETLTLSWSVKKDGSVHAVRLEGPEKLAMTEHAECVEQALSTWQFPPYSEGSEVSVRGVPIKVRGSPAASPAAEVAGGAAPTSPGGGAAATPGAAAEPPMDEPTFSTCERAPEEIAAYIRSRMARVSDCLTAERKRAPGEAIPDTLPMSFVVDVDGSVRGVRINHRFYREGPLATCVGEALGRGSLSPVAGADCPADFTFDLRRAGL